MAKKIEKVIIKKEDGKTVNPTSKTSVPKHVELRKLVKFQCTEKDEKTGFRFSRSDWATINLDKTLHFVTVRFLTGKYAGLVFDNIKTEKFLSGNQEHLFIEVNGYQSNGLTFNEYSKKCQWKVMLI